MGPSSAWVVCVGDLFVLTHCAQVHPNACSVELIYILIILVVIGLQWTA